MGKGVVCPFFSNYLFATSRCKEKEAVDKMIAHFVTAGSIYICPALRSAQANASSRRSGRAI